MDDVEDVLYTPYGVAILVVVTIVVTSLVWTCCCFVYCCYRKRHQLSRSGVTEANRDLYYLGVSDPNGTMTSGYNTAPHAYSVNSLGGENGVLHTSLDSILDEETR